MKCLVHFPACIKVSARGNKARLRQMYLRDLAEVSKWLSLFSFCFIMTHKAERYFSSVDKSVHPIGYRELTFNGKDSILSKSVSMRPARLFMKEKQLQELQ